MRPTPQGDDQITPNHRKASVLGLTADDYQGEGALDTNHSRDELGIRVDGRSGPSLLS